MLSPIIRSLLALIMKVELLKKFRLLNRRNPIILIISKIIPLRRIGRCGIIIALGIATGVLGDLILAGPIFNLKDIYSAILFSPVLIPNATTHLPLPVPTLVLTVIGYLFWPVLIWRILVYLKRPSSWNTSGLFFITFIGFFGIIHKFWAPI